MDFEKLFLNMQQCKGVGRNTNNLQQIYASFTNEYKMAFKELSVDRQIYLLAIPIKKQAKYKREGVDIFVASQPTMRHKSFMGRSKQNTKRAEQSKHQYIAEGRKF